MTSPPTRVVFVHGIRTSASMWRAQQSYLDERGVPSIALDLPGHGSRLREPFVLERALRDIRYAIRSREGEKVLLVGHSLGGLLSLTVAGTPGVPPLAGLIAASCTAIPRGAALAAYRALVGAGNLLPDNGLWIGERVLQATLPYDTRADFGAGGWAFDAQDRALSSLATLNLPRAVARITAPLWFVNGQYDQLRIHERIFTRLAKHSELIVIPRATHLVTAMQPRAFNAVLSLALATVDARELSAAEPQES